MDINEVIAAIGGPTAVPHQPEGPSDVAPLAPLGPVAQGRVEEAPTSPGSQQGAGGGYLYPGAQGLASDGTVHIGGNAPDSSGGPPQRPALPGVPGLTAGQVNRPEGGAAPPFGEAPGAPQASLAAGGGTGQGTNPMLKPTNAPRQPGEGLFK